MAFVVHHCSGRSVGAAKRLTYGLRALLSHLLAEGLIERQLAPAVPTPSGWHGSNLPRWVGAAELAALVAGGEDRSTVRRRDHAIVVMLVRLGLRPKEIVGLSWTTWTGSRARSWCGARGTASSACPCPSTWAKPWSTTCGRNAHEGACRRLFVRVSEPVGMSARSVGEVVRKACARAGLPPVSVYRLRHSAATAMLRAGASLEEVGQVLRHRSGQVTAMYAKVDFVSLRPLALPWPGDAA